MIGSWKVLACEHADLGFGCLDWALDIWIHGAINAV